MMSEGKPGTQVLIAHQNGGTLDHFFDAEGQAGEPSTSQTLPDCDTRGLAYRHRDSRQAGVGGNNASV